MITLTPTKLILEIETTDAARTLAEMQQGLLALLQHLDFESGDREELEVAHYRVVGILRELCSG